MQPKYGQHAAGFSFFGAIGIVAGQVAGGADARVMDSLDAQRAALTDDLGSEIDFVVRGANAGTKLHDHIGRIAAEAFNHLADRVRNDAELSAFASGMHKANGKHFCIDDENCARVGDVDAERDTALIRDDAIAAGEFTAHRATHDCDLIPVDLLSGEQRPFAHADCVANSSMGGVESLQDLGFVM